MAVTIIQDGGTFEVADMVRISYFAGALDNQLGIFSIHARCVGVTLGSISFGELAKVMQEEFEVAGSGLFGPGVKLLGCKVGQVGVPPHKLSGIATSPAIGTGTGATLPTQASGLISFITAKAGPAYRGRMYVPFPPASALQSTTDRPHATYVGLLDAWANDLTATLRAPFTGVIGTVTMDPIIYHRATHTFDSIISEFARNSFATQMRRGNFGKLNPLAVN